MMHPLSLSSISKNRPLRILCLGAHCDDIDIGCGATLLTMLERQDAVVTWVSFSSTAERARELKKSASRFLRRAREYQVLTWSFDDGYFPAQFREIKRAFESLKSLPTPDVVFTHERSDRHQDHRTVAELTWNTFRNHYILAYEIAKFEGGLTTPNVYVPIEIKHVKRKVKALMDCYPSQQKKRWFTEDAFRALMRIRGIESGANSGWAEGFHAEKFLIQ